MPREVDALYGLGFLGRLYSIVSQLKPLSRDRSQLVRDLSSPGLPDDHPLTRMAIIACPAHTLYKRPAPGQAT